MGHSDSVKVQLLSTAEFDAFELALKKGDKVLANSRNAGVYYQGNVAQAHSNGTFDVCYTAHQVGTADAETHVPATHIVKAGQMSLRTPHGVGTRVLANSQNAGAYHAGAVVSVNSNAFGFTYAVRYHGQAAGGSNVESGIPPSHVE